MNVQISGVTDDSRQLFVYFQLRKWPVPSIVVVLAKAWLLKITPDYGWIDV